MNYSDFISELKSRCDIVTVISKYIPLERKGNTYWGRCPFHHEKTPSFAVNNQGQYYHCFGCKESGDVIKFVEKLDSVDFMSAVKKLAESVGMQIPDNIESEEISRRKENKDKLYTLLKDAARHYYENLVSSEGENALDYLTKRGLSRRTINTFGLGYSKNRFEMIDFLRKKGYKDELIQDAGIGDIYNGKLYDVFGERIMYPIINQFGDIIGFGGRAMNPDAKAKYRNSAQTVIFDKKNVLYGINNIVKYKRENPLNSVIIVEGYMDAISLYQAGFHNVLASMGTALTARQARQMHLLCDRVYICYDGDTAGKMATMRGLDILTAEGLNVKVVSMPDGLDPDDVVKSGADNFKKLLDEALLLVDYKLKIAADGLNLENVDGKTEYAIKAVEIISELTNTIQQEKYLRYIHELTGYSTDYLKKQLEADKEDKPIVQPVVRQPDRENVSDVTRAVRFILRAALEGRHIDDMPDIYNYLENETQKKIYDYILQSAREGRKPSVSGLFDIMDDGAHADITKIIEAEADTFKTDEDAALYFDSSVRLLKMFLLNKEREELQERLKNSRLKDEQIAILMKITEIDTKQKSLKKE